jgi:hypothetical protein
MAETSWSDGFSFSAESTDVGPYPLLGGVYAISMAATWGGGNVALQQLMPDGSTYLAILTAFTADGSALVDLPPGTYKLAVTTATALQGSLVRVPAGRGA